MTFVRSSLSVEERLMSQTVYEHGCWVRGRSKTHAYITVNGETMSAYRLAYELFVGPIPLGMWIDHMCRNHRCINPLHLEPVTPSETARRRAVSGRGRASYLQRTPTT